MSKTREGDLDAAGIKTISCGSREFTLASGKKAAADNGPADEDAALARRAFVEQMNAKFVQAKGAPGLRLGAAPGATTLVMLAINDCSEASLQALVAKNDDGLVDTWRNKGFTRIGCDGTTGGHAEWSLGHRRP